MSTILEDLHAELKRRHPQKPLKPRDITTLITGIVELHRQTDAKLDQLIQAVENQPKGDKTAKAASKTAPKDKP
jgi:hypothetical protein